MHSFMHLFIFTTGVFLLIVTNNLHFIGLPVDGDRLRDSDISFYFLYTRKLIYLFETTIENEIQSIDNVSNIVLYSCP